jgi:hypothetical protein
MKQGKNPTRLQKQHIKHAGLNYANWLIIKSLHNQLHIVHRFTGTKRVIPL